MQASAVRTYGRISYSKQTQLIMSLHSIPSNLMTVLIIKKQTNAGTKREMTTKQFYRFINTTSKLVKRLRVIKDRVDN